MSEMIKKIKIKHFIIFIVLIKIDTYDCWKDIEMNFKKLLEEIIDNFTDSGSNPKKNGSDERRKRRIAGQTRVASGLQCNII